MGIDESSLWREREVLLRGTVAIIKLKESSVGGAAASDIQAFF
jgi:hypothetical protein